MKPPPGSPTAAHHPHLGGEVDIGPYSLRAGGLDYGPPQTLGEVDVLVDLTGRKCWPVQDHQRLIDLALRDFGGALPEWQKVLEDQIIPELEAGNRLLVFCAGSHGRTGLVLGSLIALLEDDSETPDPLLAVRQRHCYHAVETRAQAEAIFALRGQTLPDDYVQNFHR